jgi:predicted HAD superfamily phosphohydrolase
MNLFPGGDKVLAVVSRYAGLMAQAKKESYEPGDIFTYILPFLLLHNIQEDQLADLAYRATFSGGAAHLISQLEYSGWKIFCFTATYEEYALHITQKLGIYAHRVACTPLPLKEMYPVISKSETELISQVEKEILTLVSGNDDILIQNKLNSFYYQQLPQTGIADYLNQVKPVGGKRKLEALNKLSVKLDQPLSNWVVVGNTQEDSLCMQAVEGAKGLAIAFNADEDVLSRSTLSLASANIGDLLDVLQSWQKGGHNTVEKLVREKEKMGGGDERGYFHWLSGKTDFTEAIEVHRRLKRLIKESASQTL